jgi:hypothetical protein
LKYRPWVVSALTACRESGRGTVADGQFNWGGFLLKSNGGAQWYPQPGWQSGRERKRIRVLDCESYKTSRCESRR